MKEGMNRKIKIMKKIITMAASLLMIASVWAQVPQKMSYQSVVRNSSDALITNTAVGMQISILKDSMNGTAVYVETQTPTTNINGLVSIEIGTGTVVSGAFATIDWSLGAYFIKTQTDPTGGTNYTITGTSQLMSVPFAFYAKNADHAKIADSVIGGSGGGGATTYSIGDFVQGGIVFWVDETGEHGLVCSKLDQSTSIRWHAGTGGKTQSLGDGPYAGKANTVIIIAGQVALGDDGATYAARICNELQITEGGKTYGDWYLPSKEELNQMYVNRATIDSVALLNSGTAFAAANYWSSTEGTSFLYLNAWARNFGSGTGQASSKANTSYVRAVRAF